MIQTLLIEKLLISQEYQARHQINPEVVKDYETCLKDGIPLPAIAVVDAGTELIVVDGFHRLLAYKRQGRDRINAEVAKGNSLDALKKAIGANATHGLRRTTADKSRAVEMALNQPELAKESDRALAALCSVSHTFVARIRARLEKPPSESKFSRKTPPDKSLKVATTPPQDGEFEDYDPMPDVLADLVKENEQLKVQIAIGFAEGTTEEKAEVERIIAELRTELKNAHIEIKALTISRDQFQRENASLIQQCQLNQRRIKKLNDQLERQKQNDEAPVPF